MLQTVSKPLELIKVGINTEILKNTERRNFQTINVRCTLKYLYFEKENALLISNFPKNINFLIKW